MRRHLTVVAGLALLLAGCSSPAVSGSTTQALPGQTTQTQPSTQSTSTTALNASSTTITTQATTTTAPTTTPTTTQHASPISLGVYFYVDEAGHPQRTGPFLIPVATDVSHTLSVARAAMEQLLAGPAVSDPSISTMIPDGVRLLGLTIADGIAKVDLSSDFAADDDSAASAMKAAQVVFTLTRFPTVDDVQFFQDGKPVAVQTGDGQLVSRPVARGDYLEFAAALDIESPAYGGLAANPLRVTGFGAVFEAAFLYRLSDAEDHVLAEGQAMTDLGTGWGNFDFTVHYKVDHQQMGSLVVWDDSAKDGTSIDIRQYPVILVP